MITNLNHITLAVSNINRSFHFYCNILGFKPLCRWDKGAYFLVGEFWFCLNVDPVRTCASTFCYTHYAFSVSQSDFATMIEKLKDAEVVIFKDNTSPGDSLYFLDPDGHKLEIHAGNWQSRLEAKKLDLGSWQEVEFFI